jgi:hypothetical protein
MPKRPNVKKLAAKELQKGRVLFAAEAGEYVVARVVKSLGFCQFQLEANLSSGKVELKGLVRGLNKGGGANSSTRVRPDCYVLLSCTEGQAKKSPKTIWEIAGVANRRDEIQRLKEAGRISGHLDLDDLFDRFGQEDAEDAADLDQDIWADANPKRKRAAQMQAEAASQAAELLIRYRKAQAGVKSQVATCLHAERHTDLPDEEAAEDAEEVVFAWDAAAAGGAAGSVPGGKRQITSKRRLAALAAAEAAAAAPEELARARAWAAAQAEYEREQAVMAELERRAVPANWEDELDIDAI